MSRAVSVWAPAPNAAVGRAVDVERFQPAVKAAGPDVDGVLNVKLVFEETLFER